MLEYDMSISRAKMSQLLDIATPITADEQELVREVQRAMEDERNAIVSIRSIDLSNPASYQDLLD